LNTIQQEERAMMKRFSVMAGVFVVVSLTQLAAATVVFDNLGSAPYAGSYATFGLIDDVRYVRGMQFTASDTVNLSTIELAIGKAYWDGTTLSGTGKVQLCSDFSGAPGTLLESWTTSSHSDIGGSLETLDSIIHPQLTAGSSYWLLLTDAPGSDLGGAWFFAETNAPGIVNTIYSVEGEPYGYAQLIRGYRTRVSGVVPEPATLALLAAGGVAMVIRRRV
jgi:PEP-CTERM motif